MQTGEQDKPVIEIKQPQQEKSAQEIEKDRIDALKRKFEAVNRAAITIQSASLQNQKY